MGMALPVSCPDISDLERSYVADAMASGRLTSGPYLDRFEAEFATWAGYDHCVSVCNGSVALHLALVSLGVGPGDEVIVPTLTYAATAAAVVHAGATPVFVDVGIDGCLDVECVKQALTPKTKRILAVHLYGRRADLESINVPGVPLLVDAAEGHGINNDGHTATYSFYANKIITTGEGGAICTNSPTLADRMRHLRGQAMTCRWQHDAAGYNYRMTNVAAAIGCAQLERVGEMLARRREVYRAYRMKAGLVDACEVPWLVNLRSYRRDGIASHLESKGIETRPGFEPLHKMPPYRKYRYVGDDVAEKISACLLSLPTSSTMTVKDAEAVCDAVKDVS